MKLTALTLIALAAVAQPPNLRWQLQDSGTTARLRGVSAVSASIAWASGANGTLLRTVNGGAVWTRLPAPAGAEKLDFRDIDAFSDRVAYVLSIGAGETSRIYKTTDGGASWERIPADRLPPALPGEGAFAASGTNVAVLGQNVWIGTTASRVLRSADSGRTWAIATTPVVTGNATGIFSIAFRDAQYGVVVGGDYTKETQAGDNAALTSDGGVTWTLAKGISGFRSVAAWLPGTRSVLAVGPAGANWSIDDGRSWTPVPLTGTPAGFDALSFAPATSIGWASGAGGRISRVMP